MYNDDDDDDNNMILYWDRPIITDKTVDFNILDTVFIDRQKKSSIYDRHRGSLDP